LGKLVTWGIIQTKPKTDLPTQNAHLKVKLLAVTLFFEEKQAFWHFYGILCFRRVKKLHTAPLILLIYFGVC